VYPNSTRLHSAQIFLCNRSLFSRIRLRTRELRLFHSGDEICPEIFRMRNAQCFLHNSFHASSNLLVLSMRWNGNLMESLNISFSSFLHLWTSSQIDEDSSIHRRIWKGWWFILQLFRHDFCFLFPDMCFIMAISLTKNKAWSTCASLRSLRVHN
jgi:hypothetical protein